VSKAMFLSQLPIRERLNYYKKIKNYLISENAFSYENLVECMSEKIVDLPYELI